MGASMEDMRGKRLLITGATDGIGKAAALELARLGADLVIVGRNPAKTEKALGEIQSAGAGDHSMLLADLSSIAATKAVAAEYLARHDRLDALLNNAGASFDSFRTSADGIEMTFALNHFSYYLLGNLLLDALRRSADERGEARIINVSSSAHASARAGLRLESLNAPGNFAAFRVYAESKLANLYFTYELARRLEGTGVTVNALHPGLVKTNIGSEIAGITGMIFRALQLFIGRSPQKGAETLVYLAASGQASGVSGKYWKDKQPAASSHQSHDRDAQRQLWEYSAEVTGVG